MWRTKLQWTPKISYWISLFSSLESFKTFTSHNKSTTKRNIMISSRRLCLAFQKCETQMKDEVFFLFLWVSFFLHVTPPHEKKCVHVRVKVFFVRHLSLTMSCSIREAFLSEDWKLKEKNWSSSCANISELRTVVYF